MKQSNNEGFEALEAQRKDTGQDPNSPSLRPSWITSNQIFGDLTLRMKRRESGKVNIDRAYDRNMEVAVSNLAATLCPSSAGNSKIV